MTKIKRIYHTWDKWECYPKGFYEDKVPTGKTVEEWEEEYKNFLSDTNRFSNALDRVLKTWVNSCEHYLTNSSMNRIAWLGQAAACEELGLPSRFKGGYNLLTTDQQEKANETALIYLNKWLESYGGDAVDMKGAGVSALVNLY